jgi:hypothetical protein
MKYSIFPLFFLLFLSCQDSKKGENSSEAESVEAEAPMETSASEVSEAQKDGFFGKEFDYSQPETAMAVLEKYKSLQPGDTINAVFSSSVNSVCVKKGCWMRLKLDDNQESLVRFKDYGFFVPKDIEGQNAVVHGKLFVNETSVEDLKHYAEDAGKSEDEIAAITEPKLEFAFEADGVYLGE